MHDFNQGLSIIKCTFKVGNEEILVVLFAWVASRMIVTMEY